MPKKVRRTELPIATRIARYIGAIQCFYTTENIEDGAFSLMTEYSQTVLVDKSAPNTSIVDYLTGSSNRGPYDNPYEMTSMATFSTDDRNRTQDSDTTDPLNAIISAVKKRCEDAEQTKTIPVYEKLEMQYINLIKILLCTLPLNLLEECKRPLYTFSNESHNEFRAVGRGGKALPFLSRGKAHSTIDNKQDCKVAIPLTKKLFHIRQNSGIAGGGELLNQLLSNLSDENRTFIERLPIYTDVESLKIQNRVTTRPVQHRKVVTEAKTSTIKKNPKSSPSSVLSVESRAQNHWFVSTNTDKKVNEEAWGQRWVGELSGGNESGTVLETFKA